MSSEKFIRFLKKEYNKEDESQKVYYEYILIYFEHLYKNYLERISNYQSFSSSDNIPEILYNERKQKEIEKMFIEIKGEILEEDINVDKIISYVEMIDKIGVLIYYTTLKVSEYLDEKEYYKPEIEETKFDKIVDRIKQLKKEKQQLKDKYEKTISKLKEDNTELTNFIKNIEILMYLLIIGMSTIIIYRILF